MWCCSKANGQMESLTVSCPLLLTYTRPLYALLLLACTVALTFRLRPCNNETSVFLLSFLSCHGTISAATRLLVPLGTYLCTFTLCWRRNVFFVMLISWSRGGVSWRIALFAVGGLSKASNCFISNAKPHSIMLMCMYVCMYVCIFHANIAGVCVVCWPNCYSTCCFRVSVSGPVWHP